MNWVLFADIMWALGHILTALSCLGTYFKSLLLSFCLIAIGQVITILSRPIGRITKPRVEDDGEKIQVTIHSVVRKTLEDEVR